MRGGESSLRRPESREDEFEQLYRNEQVRLLRFLAYHGAHPEDAADASHDAWVEVLFRWNQVSRYASPDAYLRKIALNKWRRLSGRPQKDRDRAVKGGWVDLAAFDIYNKEDVKEVLESLAALPDRQRHVMAWYYDGYSPKEIAEHLGMNIDTVRSHMRHARKTLVKSLELGEEG